MHPGKLRQFALPVSDANRSETFYEQTLGPPKLFRFDDLVFFDCEGVRLLLEGRGQPISTSDICHYFAVPDIDEAVNNLESKDVKFMQQPHRIADMPDHELWMAFFNDPEDIPWR
jgi:methylmalonyl-CoA/ethylmalonyl-CoA epimerase